MTHFTTNHHRHHKAAEEYLLVCSITMGLGPMRSSRIANGNRRPATVSASVLVVLILLCSTPSSHPLVSAFITSPSIALPSPKTKVTFENTSGFRATGSRIHATTDADAAAAGKRESKPTISGKFATSEEIIKYGEEVGVKISLSTLGPGYRAVARAAHDEEQIIGYVEGFLRPGGKILHLDKMEVWKKAVDRARKENPDGYKNGGNVFGVGLLLGYLCLLHGKENGCIDAEFLAIDDEEYQHKRLVRYYKNSGFKVIKYVGEDVGDIPDRLVWGGCGTLMREKVDALLEKWTKNLFQRRSAAD